MTATKVDLMNRFVELNIKTTTVDHEPVFTVAESEKIDRKIPGGHTKNLFLKDKKGKMFLIVLLSDAKVELNKLHTKIGAHRRLSFGSAELLEEILGVKPGSVTPFSLINDIKQRVQPVLDENMLEHDVLNYHPLSNDATTSIKRDDLLKFIRSCGHEPMILAISEGEQN